MIDKGRVRGDYFSSRARGNVGWAVEVPPRPGLLLAKVYKQKKPKRRGIGRR